MDVSHVRTTSFARHAWGYSTDQVDQLLGAAARDLAAGRSPEARVRKARLERTFGYDVCAVDLFLADLCRLGSRTGGDAWQEMTVGHQRRLDPDTEVDFDALPGIRLYVKRDAAGWRSRLTTERGEVMTSAWGSHSITVDGVRYKLRRTNRPDKWDDPELQAIARRSLRDAVGHHAAGIREADLSGRLPAVDELCGPDGTTVLSISGSNLDHRATASISFGPDDFLRFPVGGWARQVGMMTAVDGRGTRVACYRLGSTSLGLEVAINPEWELTLARVTAIAMSAPFFAEYFRLEDPDGPPHRMR